MEGLNPEEIRMTMTYIWQAQPIQLLANTAGKVSIAALLVTLHGPKYAKSKTIFIWTLAAISTIFVIIAIVMIYVQCSPVAKLWHESLPGSCDGRMRNQTFAYVQGGELAMWMRRRGSYSVLTISCNSCLFHRGPSARSLPHISVLGPSDTAAEEADIVCLVCVRYRV